MIRHPSVKRLVLLLAGISIGLCAASVSRAADGAAVAEQCAACHGKDGASNESSVPIIGGLSAKYIVDSIKNFRKKERPCAEVTLQSGPKKGTRSDMCKVARESSDADAEAVARYLAGRKFARAKQPFDAARVAQGGKVYNLRCKNCHENGGSSPDEDNGILAGQWTPYLREQLAAFRAGTRAMDEKMKTRLDKVDKADEEALLHFFASRQ